MFMSSPELSDAVGSAESELADPFKNDLSNALEPRSTSSLRGLAWLFIPGFSFYEFGKKIGSKEIRDQVAERFDLEPHRPKSIRKWTRVEDFVYGGLLTLAVTAVQVAAYTQIPSYVIDCLDKLQ